MKLNLSKILNSTLILEGRYEDVLKKYGITERGDIEVIDYLSKEDPSGNNKYLDWMAKVWMGHTKEMPTDEEILDLVKKFHQNVSRIKNKDINSYTFKDLNDIVDEAVRKSYTKKAKKNVIKVFENDDILVLAPLSIEASCKYGAGTKWCIAATNNQMVGNPHFESYTQHSSFYFLINKKMTKEENPSDYKYALQWKRDGDKFTWWDAKDNSHSVAPWWVTDEVLRVIKQNGEKVDRGLLKTKIKDFLNAPNVDEYVKIKDILTEKEKTQAIDTLIKQGFSVDYFPMFKEDLTESQMKTLITKFVKLAIKSERFKFKSFDLIKDYLSKEQLFNILESHPSLLENEEVVNWIDNNFSHKYKHNLVNKIDKIKRMSTFMSIKLIIKKWSMTEEELEEELETSYYAFLSSGDWDTGQRENFIDSLVKVDRLDPSSHKTLNMMKMRKQFQPATKLYMIKTTNGLLDDYVGMSDKEIDDPILDSIKQRAIEIR
jgi:hypothetical protein